MKILQVIHGYPLLFNAGSEVYTQTLAHGLKKLGFEVEVFSREENPFLQDFNLRTIEDYIPNTDLQIKLHLVNVPRQKDRYVNKGVDLAYKKVLTSFQPDLVHFQHLNHLSLTLIDVTYEFGIPIFFTLHDYWLACPRGQFLQINYGFSNPYALCDGQSDEKCAIHCYNRYITGIETEHDNDLIYWTNWVRKRQEIVERIIKRVSLFISPSMTVLNRMTDELGIDKEKILYLDYGFDLQRLKGRKRVFESKFVFGYIGRHTVEKGIDILIKAFSRLEEPCVLRIWGRPRGETTGYLKLLIKELNIPDHLEIQWLPEYNNFNIVKDVFNNIDALVVPSIWDENSPLVIHEALQARCLVITADHGGMGEYVKHKVNGLTFRHRDETSLYRQMKYVLENKDECFTYAKRGYLQSDSGDVVSVSDHINEIIKLYKSEIDSFAQTEDVSK